MDSLDRCTAFSERLDRGGFYLGKDDILHAHSRLYLLNEKGIHKAIMMLIDLLLNNPQIFLIVVGAFASLISTTVTLLIQQIFGYLDKKNARTSEVNDRLLQLRLDLEKELFKPLYDFLDASADLSYELLQLAGILVDPNLADLLDEKHLTVIQKHERVERLQRLADSRVVPSSERLKVLLGAIGKSQQALFELIKEHPRETTDQRNQFMGQISRKFVESQVLIGRLRREYLAYLMTIAERGHTYNLSMLFASEEEATDLPFDIERVVFESMNEEGEGSPSTKR